MKKLFHTLLLSAFCFLASGAFAQVLKYQSMPNIRHKDKDAGYTTYVAQDGAVYRVGNKLRVITPGNRSSFKGIEENKFAGLTFTREGLTQLEVVSIVMYVDQFAHSADACTHYGALLSKDPVKGKIYRVLIDVAIENGEIELMSEEELAVAAEREVNVPKPSAPANLQIQSVSFSDKNGNNNNILDANEKAEISLTLINSGKGDAYSVETEVKAINSVNGVTYPKQTELGTLSAGEQKVINIPITASLTTESGTTEFEIAAKEGNGFDSEPIRISFSVQKFRNPVVAIADHKFSSADNKVKINEATSLEIILQNQGQGEAFDVNVNFKNPQYVFPGGETSFSIKSLKPNETKNVSYEFFANRSYTAKEIPIEVIITERYGKFGDKQTFKVSVGENLSQTQVVTVAGQAEKDVKIDNVSLRPVVETSAQPTLKEEIGKSASSSGLPTFYSLFIGVDKYQHASSNMPNLDKPVSDATLLRNTLLSSYAFDESKSVFLKNPTNAEIIGALEDLVTKVTPKDNLLIFYAGHGYWDDILKVGYWLPSDSGPTGKTNWIPNGTVKDYIQGIKSKHTLLITDACFGGGIFKTREVSSTELNASAMAMVYRLSSRKAMTSGTLTTVPDDSQFMKFLVKRLADNTSEYLTSRQLFFSIETAILRNSSTVPQLGVIHDTGDEGGDFVFIRPKK